MIKAIDTVYNGYKFRSRLEARWAVFFDEIGIEYRTFPKAKEAIIPDTGIIYYPAAGATAHIAAPAAKAPWDG